MNNASATILFIDDVSNISGRQKSSLEKNGYQILNADSGRNGLDILKCVRPDLIFVHLGPAEADRQGILTKIKTTTSKIPLIAMSPSASAEDLIAALRMGAWDFLPAADQNEQGLLQMIAKHLYRCRRNGQPASYPERLEQLLSDRSIELAEKCAELKQCKAELLESQLKMRQVQNLESIGTLAGGIAHDLNNILSPILCFTELSLLGLPSGKDIEKYLDEILNAGLRARELVKQISEFSHLEDSDKRSLELIPLIKETIKFLKSTLPSTIEIEFVSDISDSVVTASPAQIRQLLMNLCNNAAHAMKDTGGMLSISLEAVPERSDKTQPGQGLPQDDCISLSVADTGCGILPEIIEKVFMPAFTTKPKAEGNGMGLAVVKEIMEDIGGHVSVTSEPGNGACFKVLFPQRHRTTVGTVSPTLSPATGKGKILLVDDDQLLIRTGQEMLQQFGYEVIATTSSPEALEIFKARPDSFQLVMTDMTMPKMTGIELSEQLIAIRPDLPVVLCTGFSNKLSYETIKKAGIRKLVMKPIIFREMAEALEQALHPDDSAMQPDTALSRCGSP